MKLGDSWSEDVIIGLSQNTTSGQKSFSQDCIKNHHGNTYLKKNLKAY